MTQHGCLIDFGNHPPCPGDVRIIAEEADGGEGRHIQRGGVGHIRGRTRFGVADNRVDVVHRGAGPMSRKCDRTPSRKFCLGDICDIVVIGDWAAKGEECVPSVIQQHTFCISLSLPV